MIRQPFVAIAFAAFGPSAVFGADGSTTVSVYAPLAYGVPIEASVIKADAEKTTYAVSCAPDVPSKSCGIPKSSWTLMQGPSTLSQDVVHSEYALPAPITGRITEGMETLAIQTQSVGCKINPGNNIAQCDVDFRGTVDSSLLVSQMKVAISDFSSELVPMTITAGVEKLATASEVSNTDTSSSRTSTPGASVTPAPTQTGASTDIPTSTSSDNGAPPTKATQNALLALAAMVGGGAFAL